MSARSQRLELRLQRPGVLGQALGRYAVLARELLDGGQAALDLFLARGVDVERLDVMLQLARRLAHLDDGLFDQRQRGGELGIERSRPSAVPAARG